MITQNLTTLKINKLTQNQYNTALEAGTINEDELYMTPDDNELDTTSFLRVTDTGSAVDVNPIDADTLNGKTASDFLTNENAKSFLPIAGGTMTGALSFSSSIPIQFLDADNNLKARIWVVESSGKVSLQYKGSDGSTYTIGIQDGYITNSPKVAANTDYTTAQLRNVIISTEDPSGGSNGDIWIKYTE